MAKIRSKNTKVERLVFRELRKGKIYFYKHYETVGSPDVSLPKKKKAVFIDGDFWHGYRFSELKKRLPKRYWLSKIERNIQRDRENRAKLKRLGWKVLRVWEHEIKKDPNKAVEKIIFFLKD